MIYKENVDYILVFYTNCFALLFINLISRNDFVIVFLFSCILFIIRFVVLPSPRPEVVLLLEILLSKLVVTVFEF